MTQTNPPPAKPALDVSIRKATESDLLELSEVAMRTFKVTFREYYSEESMLDILTSTFSAPQLQPYLNDIYVAVSNPTNTIVGYYQKQDMESEVSHFPRISRSYQLKRFYIDEPFYGRGLSQMMMDHFLSMKKGRLCWLTVFKGNKRAIRFYSKYGFVRKEGEEILWSEHLLLDGSKDIDEADVRDLVGYVDFLQLRFNLLCGGVSYQAMCDWGGKFREEQKNIPLVPNAKPQAS
ncbi:hypothetical protein HDV05_001806 [Chytridiales sp. JEL 0842]|nr:hypothetical protein HDV05_001806 [Chytridiales sp. JEL 0842]